MKIHSFSIARSETAPAWASLVERWYQLDAAAYAFADAFWHLKPKLPRSPDLLFLASPGASNATDFEFAQTGFTSAAKFVHTLPNVRGTSLYQVMNWSGPMLCLQNGKTTVLSALGEAMDEFLAHPREIWVFALMGPCDVRLFQFSNGNLTFERKPSESRDGAKIDKDLVSWLRHPQMNQPFTWVYGSWERTLRATSL